MLAVADRSDVIISPILFSSSVLMDDSMPSFSFTSWVLLAYQ